MTLKSMMVRIGGDPSGLETAFKKADGYVQRHSEKFKKAGRAMTVAGAAIVGVLGTMVKGYVSAGDEVHKMALRTGLSTEALSELKYAAEISGTSLATVEKGVKKMASSIGEAELGLKTYTDAFALIGMEVKEFAGLNPEEQFMKMAAGIAAIEDPTKRAYAAQKLLGRAGTELLPLFAEGVEGMEALRRKAHEMGVVFDQEAAAKAAALNDSMLTLKRSFQGVGLSIADKLVPIIKELADKVSEIAQKIKDWTMEHPGLTDAIVKGTAAAGALMLVFGPLVIVLPQLVAGLVLLKGAFLALVGPIGAVAIAAGVTYKIVNDLINATNKATDADYEYYEANRKLGEKLREAADAAGMTRAEFHQLTLKYNDNNAALAMAIKKGKEGKEIQESLAKVGKEHADVIEEQKKQLAALNSTTDTAITKFGNLHTVIKPLPGATYEFTQAMSHWNDMADVMWRGFDNLEMAAEDTEISFDGLYGSTEDVANAVFRAAGQFPPFETAMEDWGKVAKTTTKEVETLWGTFTDGLRTKWSSSFGQMIRDFGDFGEINFKSILDGMWIQWTDMLGQMLAEWTTKLLGGLFDTAKEKGPEIVKSLTETATTAAEAAGSAISSVWGGIIGGAISGLATLITGAGTQGLLEATNRQLDNIWAEARNILNNVDNIKWIAEDMKQTLWRMADNQIPILDDIKNAAWSIVDGVGDIADAIGNITTAQTGFHGTVPRPALIGVHPGEQIDITPFGKMGGAPAASPVINHYHTYEIYALDSQSFEDALKRGPGSVIEKRIQKAIDLKNIRVPISGVGR